MVATIPGSTNGAAHTVLRDAHGKGYRFPEGFLGFAADITVTKATAEETTVATGSVTVGGPRAILLALDADEAIQGWAKQEIASMAGHRWPTSYEESDGRYQIALGDDTGNPLGVELTFDGDPFSSAYRVANGRIAQVTRSMGPMRFTITMQRHEPTADGRALPSEFTVSYWNTQQDRLTRSDIYSDRYAEVDGVAIPQSRTVVTADDTGFTTNQLLFSNVRLLTEPVEIAPAPGEQRHGTRAG